LHLLKYLQCLLTLPTFYMSQCHGDPSDHASQDDILLNTPLASSNAATFCINVNQAIAHKDVQLVTTLNDILMNTPALFKCNYTGQCI
jgi:hypothetical protein